MALNISRMGYIYGGKAVDLNWQIRLKQSNITLRRADII